jgi:hypothetical protein
MQEISLASIALVDHSRGAFYSVAIDTSCNTLTHSELVEAISADPAFVELKAIGEKFPLLFWVVNTDPDCADEFLFVPTGEIIRGTTAIVRQDESGRIVDAFNCRDEEIAFFRLMEFYASNDNDGGGIPLLMAA